MQYNFKTNVVENVDCIERDSDGAFIPLDAGNQDCLQFLIDWKAGAAVTDQAGSPVAYSDAAALALGLPAAP